MKDGIRPRKYQGMEYVLSDDIYKFYGSEWFCKFSKWYVGQTGLVIPAKHKSHGKKGVQFGIYWHDFERGRDLINENKSTYWD